ncbi:MAG: TetR/AcrR family transcriptional regulator [Alphaproteobacteria bacterium]
MRRETILEIARDMFFTEGYAAVSMSAIAARLGGSKGTLYNYFASKEELFGAVMTQHFDRVGALMRGMAFEPGDTAERLRVFGFKFLKLILSDEYLRLYRLVTAEAARFPEIGGAFHGSGMIAHKQALADFFEGQMQAGALRKADPAIAARQFLDLCRSDFQRLRVWNIIAAPTDAELQAQAAQATDAIMALYAP